MSDEAAGGGPPTLEKRPAAPADAAADPAGPDEERGPKAPRAGSGRRGRFWSERRLPALLLALVLAFATGALLYDLAAVRAGHEARAWRRELAEQLAGRSLSDGWVLGTAVAVALLGLWLLLLALTPGTRWLLTMRGAPGLRAGIDRRTAAAVLRGQAVQVPGVRSAKVTVRRRSVRARAVAHFRELDAVRADLRGVLADTVADLGLARAPRLSVHVRRPDRH
ncbi:DUF6286 domain-containing protein [Streptomyces sp. JJ38]|uniref:DUF6286 domain-containing protein n=1 Tax=Streptomyces sp. JJ38 TaxID=2738128 RepID=UPI001C59D862|nr:DUF6286 domain-containing protein [Streptomyces sp. JJ38]MBW1597569.1 hypothetical protein [Streptomyces sp. JJ38]